MPLTMSAVFPNGIPLVAADLRSWVTSVRDWRSFGQLLLDFAARRIGDLVIMTPSGRPRG